MSPLATQPPPLQLPCAAGDQLPSTSPLPPRGPHPRCAALPIDPCSHHHPCSPEDSQPADRPPVRADFPRAIAADHHSRDAANSQSSSRSSQQGRRQRPKQQQIITAGTPSTRQAARIITASPWNKETDSLHRASTHPSPKQQQIVTAATQPPRPTQETPLSDRGTKRQRHHIKSLPGPRPKTPLRPPVMSRLI